MLEGCYTNTDEQQRWNCVIQIQMNSNAGIVLFKHGGTATLEVCDSNTDEQQRWNCVIQIRRNNNAPWRCVIKIQRNSNAAIVLFKYRGTQTLELCYSNTQEQER